VVTCQDYRVRRSLRPSEFDEVITAPLGSAHEELPQARPLVGDRVNDLGSGSANARLMRPLLCRPAGLSDWPIDSGAIPFQA
jgi:hypothetical protein